MISVGKTIAKATTAANAAREAPAGPPWTESLVGSLMTFPDNQLAGVVVLRIHAASAAPTIRRLCEGTLTGSVTAQLATIQLPLNELPTREQWTSLAAAGGYEGYNAQTQLARLDRGEELLKAVLQAVKRFLTET